MRRSELRIVQLQDSIIIISATPASQTMMLRSELPIVSSSSNREDEWRHCQWTASIQCQLQRLAADWLVQPTVRGGAYKNSSFCRWYGRGCGWRRT